MNAMIAQSEKELQAALEAQDVIVVT